MKKTIITAILVVSLFFFGFAQAEKHYYFFCINKSENFDARWVVDQIDPILTGMKPGDRFTVYYATGADKSGVILEALEIKDLDFWRSKKEKLKKFEAEKIQCNANANVENIMDIFDKIYDFDKNGLNSSNYIIDVYWFGDDAHYSEFGESLVLNVYMICSGNSTWNSYNLRNNNAAPLKTDNVQMLLNSKLIKTKNIFVK